MDYDSRWNNFDALVKKLQFETTYQPGEEELELATLLALSAMLKSRNMAEDEAYQPVSLARAQRDLVLYHPKTGLIRQLANDLGQPKQRPGRQEYLENQISRFK